MGLVDRQWAYGNGNVMDTATYSYGDPWHSTNTYSYAYNGQVATLPSQAVAQTHTVVTSPSTSTTVQRVTAPSTTGTPTQGQTSTDAPTRPAAMEATTNPMTPTSPTTSPLSLAVETSPLSLAVETTSSPASDRGVTRSSGATFGVSTSSPAITVASSSSTAAQLVPTGPSGIANSEAPVAGRMGKGEIAGIVLAIMFALGLGCVFYKVWRRKAAQRPERESFIQYPFSTDAARASTTTRMTEVLPPVLDISRTLAERDSAHWDVEAGSTTAATLATSSPTGASGYDSGLAVYPLGEKSRVHSAATPSRFSAPFALPSPLSPSPLVHSPISPASCNNPIAPLLAAHNRHLSSAAPTLPYAWDHPPPRSGYLSRTSERRSTFRASWFHTESGGLSSPARASYGTLSSTPAYSSSGILEADSRPPSYSRY